MKLQKQPNNWSCIPTAFAIALDVPYSEILEKIGHDGSRIVFSGLPEPRCRRSFSINELIPICLDYGYTCIPIIKNYTLDEDSEIITIPRSMEFIEYYLNKYSGVICGFSKSGMRHAVAWDRNEIYDPSGKQISKEDFGVEVFFIVTRLGVS